MRRHLVTTLAAVSSAVLAAGLAGCGDDRTEGLGRPVAESAEEDAATSTGAGPSWLFVLDAGAGTWDAATSELRLSGVDPAGLRFSDRPDRMAGTVATRSLVDDWDRLFDDPPNAALHAVADDGASVLSAVELGTPRWDGTDLVVPATAVPAAGAGGVHDAATVVADTPPPSFTSAFLFVDPSADPAYGGGEWSLQLGLDGTPTEPSPFYADGIYVGDGEDGEG